MLLVFCTNFISLIICLLGHRRRAWLRLSTAHIDHFGEHPQHQPRQAGARRVRLPGRWARSAARRGRLFRPGRRPQPGCLALDVCDRHCPRRARHRRPVLLHPGKRQLKLMLHIRGAAPKKTRRRRSACCCASRLYPGTITLVQACRRRRRGPWQGRVFWPCSTRPQSPLNTILRFGALVHPGSRDYRHPASSPPLSPAAALGELRDHVRERQRPRS